MRIKKKGKKVGLKWKNCSKVVNFGTQTVATELCDLDSSKDEAACLVEETVDKKTGGILRRNAKSLEDLNFERKSSRFQRKWKSAKCKGGYIKKYH